MLSFYSSSFALTSDSTVTATVSSIQNISFPALTIGNIDPSAAGLSTGYLTQGEVTMTCQSNGSAGYTVVVSQVGVNTGAAFSLTETGGADAISLFLYKDTSQAVGVNPSLPTDGTQLTGNSEVYNFGVQTLPQQSASIKAVMPGAQFSTISEGNYSATITMTLTDQI